MVPCGDDLALEPGEQPAALGWRCVTNTSSRLPTPSRQRVLSTVPKPCSQQVQPQPGRHNCVFRKAIIAAQSLPVPPVHWSTPQTHCPSVWHLRPFTPSAWGKAGCEKAVWLTIQGMGESVSSFLTTSLRREGVAKSPERLVLEGNDISRAIF